MNASPMHAFNQLLKPCAIAGAREVERGRLEREREEGREGGMEDASMRRRRKASGGRVNGAVAVCWHCSEKSE